jgi:endoglucanase
MFLAPRGALLLGAALVACSLQDVSSLNRCTGKPDSVDCPFDAGGAPSSGGTGLGGTGLAGVAQGGTASGVEAGAAGVGAGVGASAGEGEAGAAPEPLRLRVQYDYPPPDPITPADMSKAIRADLQIVNDSAVDVPLSGITLRYYYTSEAEQCSDFACLSVNHDAVVNACKGISLSFQSYDSPSNLANAYWELSFDPAVAADWVLGANGGVSGNIKLQAFKPNFALQDLRNDYSFDASLTALTDWPQITLYRDGVLLFGTPP